MTRNSNSKPLTASERIRLARAYRMLDTIRAAAQVDPSTITTTSRKAA
jgi:hypothetical protein